MSIQFQLKVTYSVTSVDLCELETSYDSLSWDQMLEKTDTHRSWWKRGGWLARNEVVTHNQSSHLNPLRPPRWTWQQWWMMGENMVLWEPRRCVTTPSDQVWWADWLESDTHELNYSRLNHITATLRLRTCLTGNILNLLPETLIQQSFRVIWVLKSLV